MSPIVQTLICAGIPSSLALLGWILWSINKLLVRQAVDIDGKALDVLTTKVEKLAQTSAELSRALEDFQSTLSQFIRKVDRRNP